MTDAIPNYKWQAIFKIEGLALKQDFIQTPQFKISKSSRTIAALLKESPAGLHETMSILSKHVVYCEYVFQTQSLDPDPEELAIRMISTFLNTVVLGSGYVLTIPPRIRFYDLEIKCTNIKEILEAKRPLRSVMKATFSSHYSLSQGDLTKLVDQIPILETLSESDLVSQLTLFYRNAGTSDDEYGCFMSLYVGFNALYNRIAGTASNDGKKIERLLDFILRGKLGRAQGIVDNFLKVDRSKGDLMSMGLIKYGYNDIFDGLVKQNLVHSQKLKKAIESNDAREILWKSLLCMKDVRNKIFHGHYSIQELDDKRMFIALCSTYLAYMFRLGINCLIHDIRAGLAI